MITDEKRIRVRQDSWQFVACLNVLRDPNGTRRYHEDYASCDPENSRKNEKSHRSTIVRGASKNDLSNLCANKRKLDCNNNDRASGSRTNFFDKDKVFISELDQTCPDPGHREKICSIRSDVIVDAKKSLEDIRAGMEFTLVVNSKNIYCVICAKMLANTSQAHLQHYCQAKHLERLATMKRNVKNEKNLSRQTSHFELARNYMKVISSSVVCCLACLRDIENLDTVIDCHKNDAFHRQICQKMRDRVEKNFRPIEACLIAESEKNSFERENLMENFTNLAGQSFDRNLKKLPKSAIDILFDMESFIDDMINRRKALIRSVERTISFNYPLVKARTYRSTIHGADSLNNDVDVYLDFRLMWHERTPTKDQISYVMTSIRESLMSNGSDAWDIGKIFNQTRSWPFPFMEARHAATGLSSGIYYYDNDLGIENMELIKSFDYIFPSYRRLIIFIRQWLKFCDLSGLDRISNYALYWQVIFYLQIESKLPSIAELVVIRENNFDPIKGWDIGALSARNSQDHNIEQLIVNFFKFYANFDFLRDVACPLIGKIVKKRDFHDLSNLRKIMPSYIVGGKNFEEMKKFHVDCAMCVQDPFEIRENLTKNTSKANVDCFRAYCYESFSLLSSK